jgi:hypothetical protein
MIPVIESLVFLITSDLSSVDKHLNHKARN